MLHNVVLVSRRTLENKFSGLVKEPEGKQKDQIHTSLGVIKFTCIFLITNTSSSGQEPFLFSFFKNFTYLFIGYAGSLLLHRFSSSALGWDYPLVTACGLPIAAVSSVAEH